MTALHLVFDLDGTLIDSVPDIQAAVAQMLADEGRGALDRATVLSFVGHGLPALVARVIAHTGMDPADHPRLTKATLDHYTATPAKLSRPYPGVAEALTLLQDAGHAMAICTNKPLEPARKVLEQLDLLRFFPVVIGGDSLPVAKPDPAPLVASIRALGGGPALFVGDSEVDADTATAAGQPFALFTEGYRKSPLTALRHDAAFSRFADLPALVAGWPLA